LFKLILVYIFYIRSNKSEYANKFIPFPFKNINLDLRSLEDSALNDLEADFNRQRSFLKSRIQLKYVKFFSYEIIILSSALNLDLHYFFLNLYNFFLLFEFSIGKLQFNNFTFYVYYVHIFS
jgi:hypothetical protein